MTPEGLVKKKLKELLNRYPIFYFFPFSLGYSTSGVPDVVGCCRGKFFGIECKADRSKKATPLQLKCKEQIEKVGGKWFLVCDELSLREVEIWIEEEL